ncbi:MAG: hypothetical protein ACRYG7_25245 [Janthinobacterium lividum]
MVTLQTSAPAISCFALAEDDYNSRIDAAEEYVEQMCLHYNVPVEKAATISYGRERLWYPSFPSEYVAAVSKLPLYEVAVWHNCLSTWANDKKTLDLADYCFLADVLREGLASNPTPLATLRLNRALAWVEQAGTVLLAEQATMAPMVNATDEPLMTASAA